MIYLEIYAAHSVLNILLLCVCSQVCLYRVSSRVNVVHVFRDGARHVRTALRPATSDFLSQTLRRPPAFSLSDTSDEHGETCQWALTTMRQRKSRVNLERRESTYAAVLPGPVHHRLVVSRVLAQRKRRTCQLKLLLVQERSVLHTLCPESGPGLRASRASSSALTGHSRVLGHDIWQLLHLQAAVLSNIGAVLLQVRVTQGRIRRA